MLPVSTGMGLKNLGLRAISCILDLAWANAWLLHKKALALLELSISHKLAGFAKILALVVSGIEHI